MSKSPSGFRAVAKLLPKEVEPVEDEQGKPEDERDIKRQTFYLPTAVHDQFRDLAHAKRCSQQELFRMAADLLFGQEGLPSWEKLAPRKRR